MPPQPPPQGTLAPVDLAPSWVGGPGVQMPAPLGIGGAHGYSWLPSSGQSASGPSVTLTSPSLFCKMGLMDTYAWCCSRSEWSSFFSPRLAASGRALWAAIHGGIQEPSPSG